MVGGDLSLSQLPMVCSIGSWADAGDYRWMALMLGLAASFHVLVGGWAFLAVVGWLVLRRKTHLSILGIWGRFFNLHSSECVYCLGWCWSSYSLPPHRFCTAFLCVCLSAMPHLNPLSWPSNWWIERVYLLVLVLSVGMLWRQHQSEKFSEQYAARMGLAEFTLITLVPFILGLVVAPLTPKAIYCSIIPSGWVT